MKRFIFGITMLSAVLLMGCVQAEGTYQEQLITRIEQAISGATAGPTYSHGIYSYYKEPSIGRVSSEQTSNIFVKDGVRFVMNLNVSAIVNEKYYENSASISTPQNMEVLAECTGTFADFMGQEHPFDIQLSRLEDQVFTSMKTDLLEFFSISNELEALQTAETMMRMARTVRVDNEAVIAAYSGRQEIDYVRKRLELFQNVVPENGRIEELFEGNGNYAGVADDYNGDNIGDNLVSEETIDSATGDGDDQIGSIGGADDTIDSSMGDANDMIDGSAGDANDQIGEPAGDVPAESSGTTG